jgi:hypothetical protein
VLAGHRVRGLEVGADRRAIGVDLDRAKDEESSGPKRAGNGRKASASLWVGAQERRSSAGRRAGAGDVATPTEIPISWTEVRPSETRRSWARRIACSTSSSEGRDCLIDQLLRPIDENSGGLTLGVFQDLAAGRVGVSGDPGPAEGLGVCPSGMSIDPA